VRAEPRRKGAPPPVLVQAGHRRLDLGGRTQQGRLPRSLRNGCRGRLGVEQAAIWSVVEQAAKFLIQIIERHLGAEQSLAGWKTQHCGQRDL
jgi:hypothetical protein